MISLARYAALLEPREMRQLFAASMIGRLPIGITGLAILILVQSATGSFARGGAATGCYVAGLAVVAPVLGRADRSLWTAVGPDRVRHRYFPPRWSLSCRRVRGCRVLGALALAAAAGASFPPITVCMRTTSEAAAGRDALLSTAYSLESVLIEMIFIVGPMLVALFVAVASPAVAGALRRGLRLRGTLLFLRSPALRAWHIEPRAARSLLGPLAEPGFAPLIGVILCYSIAFGLLEIGLTAYATEAATPRLPACCSGFMSAGSALGGLAYGSRSWHFPLVRQFALCWR